MEAIDVSGEMIGKLVAEIEHLRHVLVSYISEPKYYPDLDRAMNTEQLREIIVRLKGK